MMGAKSTTTTTTTTTTITHHPDGHDEIVRKQDIVTTQYPTIFGKPIVQEAEEHNELEDKHADLPNLQKHRAIITGNAMVAPSINPVRQTAVRSDSRSTIQWDTPPTNYYSEYPGLVSSCQGQKRALLIGIVYRGSEQTLEDV
ncbi:hypothetical protein BDV3_000686 [Batrachochytrium dendrobatidis]